MKSLSALLLAAVLLVPAVAAQANLNEEGLTKVQNNGQGRIEILKALWGAQGYRPLDATYYLQGRVNSGERRVWVQNGSMGADPAPGIAKSLRVTYRIGSRKFTQVVAEGAILAFDR